MNVDLQPRAQWRSLYSYILVTTGAVVGLGNIFYFPFFVIKFGGLFVLSYVLCELFISVPLLFSELLIGRRGKQNPVGAIGVVALESDASSRWRFLGWLCFLILFLTLSYYIVMVAFPLEYLFNSLKLLISSDLTNTFNTNAFFPLEICFLLFLFLTMAVIIRGINRGLEKISFIVVPLYFIILLGVAFFLGFQGNFLTALQGLFQIIPDQSLLEIMLIALVFAFFKLNVGMGSMMVYGSYLPYNVSLGKSTGIIIGLDALASLLSYFIISPMSQNSSAGLSLQNMGLMFSSMPHGIVVASLFFLAAVIAAWTATIAIAESAAITMIERWQISRVKAVIILSNTLWPDVLIFSHWTIEGFIKNFASDMATPIAATLIAIFCGWIVAKQITYDELGFSPVIYNVWRVLVKYVCPVFIIFIFLMIGFV
jgi:NSS family neurotransmitter:Na+ symporter